MDSGKRINYNLRPAKAVERKMLSESLRRLSSFRQLKSYQYVGFGSYYFSDFKLFHRDLHISRMTSIEINGSQRKRFDINKPYNCIDIIYGRARDKLKEVPWRDAPAIVWLDYDTVLDYEKLQDIRYVCNQLVSGSVLIVTVNAHPYEIHSGRNDQVDDESSNESGVVPVDTVIAPSETYATTEQRLEVEFKQGDEKEVVEDVDSSKTVSEQAVAINAKIETTTVTLPLSEIKEAPKKTNEVMEIVDPIQDQEAIMAAMPSALPLPVEVVSESTAPLPSDHVTKKAKPKKTGRLEILKNHVGERYVPAEIEEKDLRQWGLARVCRRIIYNHIEESLTYKNGVNDRANKLYFHQLFNFHYEDGAKMLTFGGVIYDEGNETHLRSCGFQHLEHTREGEEPFLIEVPNLTYHEIRALNSKLPNGDLTELATIIPQTDIDKYKVIYRHFPSFTEGDVS